MKKIVSLIVLVIFTGAFSLMAQQVSYTVKTSAKCTNLTAEFSVPANKVANLRSLDAVPTFQSCSTANPNLTSIVVTITSKTAAGSRVKPTIYYKKTFDKTGLVTESVASTSVKLLTGSYILEVSPCANTEATLNLELFDN